MMLTITKQCQPRAADCSYQYYWQVALNIACRFNILTECPKITFRILKTACRDSESFLNSILALQSTETTTHSAVMQ